MVGRRNPASFLRERGGGARASGWLGGRTRVLGAASLILLTCGLLVAAEKTLRGPGHQHPHHTIVPPNPIQVENAKPGTTNWYIRGLQSTKIQGYASDISVRPGTVVGLHVSTASGARYRIEIYRLGWYRGDGGRLMACLPSPSCNRDEQGVQQKTRGPNPRTGELDAGWPVTDNLAVGANWTSGYYVAKLVLTSGRFKGQASYIYFVVGPRTGANSPLLVQASVNTWEAYNNWGGKSLYDFNSTHDTQATMVSFDRPFSNDSGDLGPLVWEIQLARFLERSDFDVSYQTDIDTDENPSSLLDHRLDIVSGHDEYWSKNMRAAFDEARDRGVNLAFVGADIGVWQTRYTDSDHTLIEYRSAKADPDSDPADKTTTFDDLGRPECELLGVEYQDAIEGAEVQDTYTVQPVAAKSQWFIDTGLVPGAKLPHVVGYEYDGIQPGCPVPRPVELLRWAGTPSASAVTYRAPSGARVFSDGTLSLVWALDDYDHPGASDPRVQRLFRNIFEDLSAVPRSHG